MDYTKFVDDHGSLLEAADALGISYDAMRLRRSRQRRRAETGYLGFSPVLPGFAIKSTASKVDGVWVKQIKAPGEQFEMPPGQRLTGVSALVDATGRETVKWIKTGEDREIAAWSMESILEQLAMPPRAPVPAPTSSIASLLTEYVIGDHHLGLLAWGRETGDSYDTRIGEELLLSKMDELVSRTPESSTAMLTNLGDFFHSNNARNMTDRSNHPLDVDGRYGKILDVGLRLSIACIERLLQKHDRVILNWLTGNHDSEKALMVPLALKQGFRNEPRAQIDFNPSKFFVYRHGRVMLFATHGDELRPERAALFAATQYPQIWGETTKRYAKFGHVHHRAQAGTAGSMVWEWFETLAAKDAWHAGHGYQADRSMTAITYHDVTGEWSRTRVSVA